MIELRPATSDDRTAVVQVFLACWRRSYAGVLADGIVQAMTDERADALWRRVLAERDATTIVAVDDDGSGDGGSVIGVTRLRGADIHSLYVSPDAQGGGIGSRLLAAAEDAVRAGGERAARLWVFADNAPSIAFYRARGWTPTGATRTQAEFGAPELQLMRTVGA